jgi:hypothetical protein
MLSKVLRQENASGRLEVPVAAAGVSPRAGRKTCASGVPIEFGRPSLRTARAVLPHMALQSVVSHGLGLPVDSNDGIGRRRPNDVSRPLDATAALLHPMVTSR